MMKLTQRERLLNTLYRKEVDRVPVASMTQTGTLDLMKASGASWPDAHRDAALMAKLAVAAHDVAGLESVRIPFGLIAEAQALGCEIDFHEKDINFTPSVRAGLKSFSRVKIPGPKVGLMGEMLKAVKLARTMAGEDVPIVAGVTGPFTIAGHMRGLSEMMMDLVNDPKLIHGIEESSSRVATDFCRSLAEEGADVITLIEPTGAIIGEDFFNEFCRPYLKKVISNVKVPVVLHICGYTLPLFDSMIDTGAKGLSIDQTVSIAQAKEVVKGRAALIGNVNPVAILLQSDPSGVEADCRRILGEGTDVLAPGCGLAPNTPLDNIKAMVRAGLGYKKK